MTDTDSSPHGASCPDQETLAALLEGRLAAAELDRIAPHVETCPACSGRLETLHHLSGHGAALDRMRTAGALERAVLPLLSGMLEPCAEPGSLGQLGAWPVYEVIDRGGMGIVLRGGDPALRREVAIKVLGPELAGDAECRARFLREAQAAAAVDHEHVMPVYAVCQDAALPYLVMPYNAGESLQQRLDREGALPFPETLRIARAVAAGLAAAHAQGLVHRDVKPGNILLGRDGRVRIADFGLAQAADTTRLTRSGVLAGTPGYMAPEQLDGADPDARSDLFALGAVIYRMLTGAGPFDAPTAMAVMKRVAFDEPPPIKSTLLPPPPAWFIALTGELLRKKPESRPPSAAAVMERMDRAADDPENRHRRKRTLAAGMVTVLVLSGWLWHRQYQRPHHAVSPPPTALELDLRMAAERAKTGDPAERIAWLAAALRKEPRHTGTARMLLHDLVYTPAPLPFAKGGPALPRILTTPSPFLRVTFGSDGKDIYAESENGMMQVWNARNGQPLVAGFQWPGKARVIASGGELTAFVTPDQEIWVINHRGFSLKTRLENPLALTQACVAENASILLAGGQSGGVESWDLETSQRHPPWPSHSGPVTHLLLTADGRTGVSAAADGTVHLLDFATGKQRGPELRHGGAITWAELSPDERLLATGSTDGTALVWDLATAAAVSGPLRHGSSSPPGAGIIGIFLDEQRLLTAGTEDGLAHVWEARTGAPAHEPLTHPARVTAVAAQAGEFATADANGNVRLWDAARAEPASPRLPHPAEITTLHFSPDRSKLLVTGHTTSAWLYELAPPSLQLPAWFPDLAEQLAARRLNARHVPEVLPAAALDSLRAAWTGPVMPAMPDEAGPRRIAEWLLAPTTGRAAQPFAVPTAPDPPADNTIREMLFRMFREQVEKQMQGKAK